MKRVAQKGFTILELVVVIAIIGILAAVAIPRFMDLSERAHDAVVEGTQTALASGISMAKAAWMSMGRQVALNNVVYTKGTEGTADGIDTNAEGWAIGIDQASGAGNAGVIDNNKDCKDLFEHILDENAPPVVAGDWDDVRQGADGAAYQFVLSESQYWVASKVAGTSAADTHSDTSSAITDGVDGCGWTYLKDEEDDGADRRYIAYDPSTGKVTSQKLWITDNIEVGGT